ncbi:type II toxin-antitoxin system HicB family antitoxin [Phosphitispora sp. TUW77]|uniref:type II toxin-antitoxin system HicB family antitoxin n=1 Tax=Phosphitispora sp. TUW77 TaxID=3152361 RepID=UPI003AB85152
MKRKLKFNLEKINNTIFNSKKDISEFINTVENESEIEEKCKQYYQIEYPISLKQEIENDETYWIAEHPDLPGCITHGSTKEEALVNLNDAKKSWIFGRIVDNDSIPKPSKLEEYDDCSGKILLRLPKKLH